MVNGYAALANIMLAIIDPVAVVSVTDTVEFGYALTLNSVGLEISLT
jgi:hypothetical protein